MNNIGDYTIKANKYENILILLGIILKSTNKYISHDKDILFFKIISVPRISGCWKTFPRDLFRL